MARKLYAAAINKDGVESDVVEITENTFQIDGYEVADRLLEGLMFNVKFDPATEKVIYVSVPDEDKKFFEQFNKEMWFQKIKEYAEKILKTGDEVFVSDEIAKKYEIDRIKRVCAYIQ